MSTPRSLALLICTLLAVAATGCASTVEENRELRFAHYSVALPPGWRLIELDEENEEAVAELRDSPSHFMLRVFLSTAGERDGKTLSSDDFANGFRDNEERIMIERGVEEGEYRLENVVKTEEVHGGKVFHALVQGNLPRRAAAVQVAVIKRFTQLFFDGTGEDSGICAGITRSLRLTGHIYPLCRSGEGIALPSTL